MPAQQPHSAPGMLQIQQCCHTCHVGAPGSFPGFWGPCPSFLGRCNASARSIELPVPMPTCKQANLKASASLRRLFPDMHAAMHNWQGWLREVGMGSLWTQFILVLRILQWREASEQLDHWCNSPASSLSAGMICFRLCLAAMHYADAADRELVLGLLKYGPGWNNIQTAPDSCSNTLAWRF